MSEARLQEAVVGAAKPVSTLGRQPCRVQLRVVDDTARTLEGKVAIVAGAGPGIGRSTALALARDGADVALVARRRQPLEALAAEVAEATGRKAVAVPADLADLDQCEALVERTVDELGRIDGLANVATFGGPRAPVVDMDWDGYLESVHFNVVATMKLCGLVARRMEANPGGSIVNIGTLSSTTFVPKLSRYTSTKGAMVIASKTMAHEVGRDGIRVNVVTPGFTTGEGLDEMFRQMAERGGSEADELKARAAREAALQRHVDPEDIAEAALFLLSERGRNITGVELHVNAGQWIG